MKPLAKLVLIAVIFIGIVGVWSYSLRFKPEPEQVKINQAVVPPDKLFGWKFPVAKFPLTGSNKKIIAYSSLRDPGGVSQGLPVRLKIPVIGVDTAIEDAYIDSQGRMDVPAGTINVAWFAPGTRPGNVGSAVIGGHYGNYEANKGPTVFYNLDKLGAGDKVYIVDDGGNTLAFIVRRVQLFDRNADPTTVFTSNDGLAHLNLITCEGVWNQVNDSYPDRRVVFTDAIPSEGSVSVNAPVAAKPVLPQTAIITSIPTPTPTLTPSVTPTLRPSSPRLSSAQTLAASTKTLYETPIDGLITSLLIVLIVLTAVKILRR